MLNKIKTIVLGSLLLFAATCAMANAAEDLFSQKVEPFTTLDCARCHEQVFNDLRDHGDAHRMACRDCHETFHSFGRQLQWEERVPSCRSCHDYPHGNAAPMTACLSCHRNAHAPLASLDIATLEPLCAHCHSAAAEQLQQPSAHADLSCNDCHQQQHGYLPKCTECHEQPHSVFESSRGCMQCHPVHNVSQLLYADDIPNLACAGCHEQPAQQLEKGHLAHSQLRCTFCHADGHGNTASCQECHDSVHSREMLAGFSGCNDCHGGPHALLPGQ